MRDARIISPGKAREPVYDLTPTIGLRLDRRFRARSKKRSLLLGRNGWFFNAESLNDKNPYFYRTKHTIDSTVTNFSQLSQSLSQLSRFPEEVWGAFRSFDLLFSDFLPLMEYYSTVRITHHRITTYFPLIQGANFV